MNLSYACTMKNKTELKELNNFGYNELNDLVD